MLSAVDVKTLIILSLLNISSTLPSTFCCELVKCRFFSFSLLHYLEIDCSLISIKNDHAAQQRASLQPCGGKVTEQQTVKLNKVFIFCTSYTLLLQLDHDAS